MAKIVTAIDEDNTPETISINTRLFLAGGITNCPDWQAELIDKIKNIPHLTVYNPRRPVFEAGNETYGVPQISWEYKHLGEADVIVFWFAKGSVNPIVLYELGKYGNSSETPIIIGMDPEYLRKDDVRIQTLLARPDITVHESFDSFSEAILKFLYSRTSNRTKKK